MHHHSRRHFSFFSTIGKCCVVFAVFPDTGRAAGQPMIGNGDRTGVRKLAAVPRLIIDLTEVIIDFTKLASSSRFLPPHMKT